LKEKNCIYLPVNEYKEARTPDKNLEKWSDVVPYGSKKRVNCKMGWDHRERKTKGPTNWNFVGVKTPP